MNAYNLNSTSAPASPSTSTLLKTDYHLYIISNPMTILFPFKIQEFHLLISLYQSHQRSRTSAKTFCLRSSVTGWSRKAVSLPQWRLELHSSATRRGPATLADGQRKRETSSPLQKSRAPSASSIIIIHRVLRKRAEVLVRSARPGNKAPAAGSSHGRGRGIREVRQSELEI